MQIANRFVFAVACLLALTVAGSALAVTYGNTTPFETQSNHSPNYVLGVQVEIPESIVLESFGLMYGNENFPPPDISNAIFGLYTSGQDGLPATLVAVTNPINLNAQGTYDNIAFTSTPNIPAGTYWMMALYESQASPRMTLLDPSSLVAYWSNSYGNGMPQNAPGVSTYTGQDFNYWVNGTPEGGTPVQLTTWGRIKSLY